MTPLTSVALLGRHEPRVASHSARISSFLDASARFSKEQALARGSAALLQRVLSREAASAEPLALAHWVWTALRQHIQTPDASLAVVQSLVAFTHPGRSLWDCVAWAVATRQLGLAQWLAGAASKQAAAAPSVQDALLREAVLTSDLAIVQWVLDQRAPTSSASSTRPASKNAKPPLDLTLLAKSLAAPQDDEALLDARWAVVELLFERLDPLTHRRLPLLAAQQGRLATLRVMRAHGVSLDVAVANAAAAKGHLEIVAFVGLAPTSDAMDDAAMDGDVALLQQLYTQFKCELTLAGVLRAADKGHVAVLAWAWETFGEKPYWTDLDGLLLPAFTAAVEAGRLEVLQWLYETHLERALASRGPKERRVIKSESVYLAFQLKFVDVVKFVHAHGLMDWDNWEGGNAAYYCELPTVLWLHENGLMGEPRNELTSAVYAGREDVIQWILENRPIEQSTYGVEYAALHGRAHVLELLLAKGLTGSFRAIDFAASRGHVEIIRRLIEHRRSVQLASAIDEASPAAIHGACLAGHLDVVKLLTEQPVRGGTCTTAAMDAAAGKGFLALVEYLHTHRSEGCTTAAMDSAATNGDMPMVAFLHANRSEGCSSAALEGAAVNGHFDVVKFLLANYPHTALSPAVIARRARAKGELEIALWLEQCSVPAVTPTRRGSRPMVPLEMMLPPATPIVG